jgi:miniconductance mechanosensitive channel
MTQDSSTSKPPSAETPAPADDAKTTDVPISVVQKSELEQQVSGFIQNNPTVAWLREHPPVYHVVASGATLVVTVLLFVVIRTIVLRPLLKLVSRHAKDEKDGLISRAVRESNLGTPLAWILPFLVAWRGIYLWPQLNPTFEESFGRTMLGIAIAFGLLAVSRFLAAVDILVSAKMKRPGALRGYVQALTAIIFAVGGITLIAILLGKSPIYFLTGVGAFTAILAVVLKDTLLSMFANITMTTGDTLRVGDWIEMKQHSIDGRVEKISLTSTRVRNWDETILTIPNYRFVSEVFVNYRTNDPRGGRRLRRTIRVDQRCVRLLSVEELEAAGRVPELAAALEVTGSTGAVTNIGLYRAYVEDYLEHHTKVDRMRPIVVRQNEPAPNGVAIDVLAFFFDSDLTNYERLQAAVLDHLVTSAGAFGLRIYQTGSDAIAMEAPAFLSGTDVGLLRA